MFRQLGTTEHKEIQLSQIKNFIDVSVEGVLKSGIVKSAEELVVVLAGDFNSNAYSEERFTRMQAASLAIRVICYKEFHGEKQEHTFRFGSNNASRRFDYIMAYDSIGSAVFRNVETESIGTIDIKDDAGNSISDHLGLKAVLRIK
ncbi:MAG: hypothetical protein MZV64_61960 [Ignavibacteriales bacterium]|nr:hypothetical protein [Ignavibacteriales bacterium]